MLIKDDWMSVPVAAATAGAVCAKADENIIELQLIRKTPPRPAKLPEQVNR
jgi:hypothetical protein